MLTFCFFAFSAAGRHSGRRNRMAQLGERRAECRGRCSHRPAAYGNVPGRDKAAKAPPASFHSATSPLCEEAFSRAQPAQKAPHNVGSWPSLRGLRGFCRLAVVSPHKKAPPFSSRAAQRVEKPPSAREVPRRGGGREPCHSPKYFGQPYSSLPHRLRAEPPRRGGQGVSTPFSTGCAALFPKSGTSLFKSVQNKNPKITRDAAPQTAIITTAARMGGSHCRARPG